MCLPFRKYVSLNVQAFIFLIFQALGSQPVIPNSAQHLHLWHGYAVVNPFAVGYCDLTASTHCFTVYLSDIHFFDDPGPPFPSPLRHLDTNGGFSWYSPRPCWRNESMYVDLSEPIYFIHFNTYTHTLDNFQAKSNIIKSNIHNFGHLSKEESNLFSVKCPKLLKPLLT